MRNRIGPPLTPMARRDLTEADHAEIAAGPDLTVSIGYAYGWTARLVDSRGRVLAEAYRAGSAIAAYRAAVARLPETVEFRGCTVEVA